jgi:hypothetical protein
MYQLEKYKGMGTRHICPNCGARREFARYIDDNGDYLADDVGKCNRDSKCGYHFTPKMFFAENPSFLKMNKGGFKAHRNARRVERPRVEEIKLRNPRFDLIQPVYLEATLGSYEENTFVQFLLTLFPEDAETVWQTVKKYFIGTLETKAVFWQIDDRREIRTGKIMLYNSQTGKRIGESFTNSQGERIEIKTNWIHAKLKKLGKLKDDFNLKQCYFGEHLLSLETLKPIAVCEAEKTAVIASICFPEFLWLATGGKQNLNVENLTRLGNRKIILYPDADGFEKWREIAQEAARLGLDVNLSSLIASHATDEQKADGYDLADYLINEQNELNEFNAFADSYNAALEIMLSDKSLNNQFNSILDEQKAIFVINGGLSEMEAEATVCSLDNIRQMVLSLAA